MTRDNNTVNALHLRDKAKNKNEIKSERKNQNKSHRRKEKHT